MTETIIPLIVDDREVTQHPEIPEKLTIPTVVDRLEAADFAFLNREKKLVGIERTEVRNLIQKLRSGELEYQLTNCAKMYTDVILLIEGVYDHVGGFLALYHKTKAGNSYFRSRIEPNFTYMEAKSLLIRLSELGIEVLESPNFECSLHIIEFIYHQRTKPEEEHTLFKKIRPVRIPAKMTTNPAVPMLMALCPRLPERVAMELIHRHKTIWEVIHTSDEELLEVPHFGRVLLDRLKKGIGRVV